MTFLVTEHGKPFTDGGFGNWFREAARAAGCPGAAHGLRKAGATRAAEAGATPHQLMAIFGWSTLKMPEQYTRAADRKRLARESAGLLLPLRRRCGAGRKFLLCFNSLDSAAPER